MPKPDAIKDLDIVQYHLTGPKVFGDHTEDDGTHIVILVNHLTKTKNQLTMMGYSNGTVSKHTPLNMYICKNEDINVSIIACASRAAYRGWEVATKFATLYTVPEEEREAVFNAIRVAVLSSDAKEVYEPPIGEDYAKISIK